MYTYVYIHALNKIICSVRNDFDLETFLKVTAYLLIDNTIWGIAWAEFDQRERTYDSDKDFLKPKICCDLTFNVDFPL